MNRDVEPWMERGLRDADLLKATPAHIRTERINLREENAKPIAGIDSAKGIVPLTFCPFEIITILLSQT